MDCYEGEHLPDYVAQSCGKLNVAGVRDEGLAFVVIGVHLGRECILYPSDTAAEDDKRRLCETW